MLGNSDPLLAPRSLMPASAVLPTTAAGGLALPDAPEGNDQAVQRRHAEENERAVVASPAERKPLSGEARVAFYQRYGLRPVDGTAVWTAEDSAQVAAALKGLPRWATASLRGCLLIRDKAHVGTIAATSAGWTHDLYTPGNDQPWTASVPGEVYVDHIHLYDLSFPLRETDDTMQKWFGAENYTTVIHEIGHQHYMWCVQQTRRRFQTTVDDVDAYTTAVRNARTALAVLITGDGAAPPAVVTDIDAYAQALLGESDGLVDQLRTIMEDLWRGCGDSWATDQYKRQNWANGVAQAGTRLGEVTVWQRAAAEQDTRLSSALGDVQDLPEGLGNGCRQVLDACRLLVDRTGLTVDAAAKYGGALRKIEYFEFLARGFSEESPYADTAFGRFSPNSRLDDFEWFADTFLLAALRPTDLQDRSEFLYQWFCQNDLTVPAHFRPYQPAVNPRDEDAWTYYLADGGDLI